MVLLTLGLTAAACGSDSDDAAGIERSEAADPAASDGLVDEQPPADSVDVDDLSDAELADYLLGLSDAAFEEYTADLDDDEYDQLLEYLDSYTAGGTESGDHGTGAAETARRRRLLAGRTRR